MLGDEKIQRLISLIILNIIVLVLVDVFSNLSYSQMLNDRTLEELNKNLPSEYPHINVGKHPRAITCLLKQLSRYTHSICCQSG